MGSTVHNFRDSVHVGRTTYWVMTLKAQLQLQKLVAARFELQPAGYRTQSQGLDDAGPAKMEHGPLQCNM